MKILFDQGTPVPLRRHLAEHTVDTVYERGLSTLSNGDLLDAAVQEGYEVLITTDQNLKYQQNLAKRRIAVIVLLSPHGHELDPKSTRFKQLSMARPSGITSRFPFESEALTPYISILSTTMGLTRNNLGTRP